MRLKSDLDKIYELLNDNGDEYMKRCEESREDMEQSKEDGTMGYSFDYFDGKNDGIVDGYRIHMRVMKDVFEVMSDMSDYISRISRMEVEPQLETKTNKIGNK